MAIITLTDEVPEMANVRPVCLESFGGPARVGQTATVVGWGSLRENGPQPDILQEITVKIWDNKECKDTYGPAAPGGIMDHMLCAGQAGKDSCSVSRPSVTTAHQWSPCPRATPADRCRLETGTLGPRSAWCPGASAAASPSTPGSTPGWPASGTGSTRSPTTINRSDRVGVSWAHGGN